MSGSPFGILEAKSSEKASDAQLAATDKAIAAELQMYNQSRADLAPWREAGAGAINALWSTGGSPSSTGAPQLQNFPITTSGGATGWENTNYYQPWYWGDSASVNDPGWATYFNNTLKPQLIAQGISPSTGNVSGYDTAAYQNALAAYQAQQAAGGQSSPMGLINKGPGEFKESEGYKWTLGQGLQAQQRQAAATGRMGSGDYIKDATKYAEGLASTEYDNFLNRYYKSLDPYFRLSGLGSNVAMSGANQAGQTGNALAGTYLQGGNAAAAGILGQYGAYSNAMTGAGNQIGNYLMQSKPWASGGGINPATGMAFTGTGMAGMGATAAGQEAFNAMSLMYL